MTDGAETTAAAPPQDKALQFFYDIMEPTVMESLAAQDNERRAVLACIVLSSMADHYFHNRAKPVEGHATVGRFRGHLASTNKAYALVRGIANATKHFETDGKIGYDDTKAENVSLSNLRAGMPINGRYVFVESPRGHKWMVRDLLFVSLDMWRIKLGLDIS